VLQLLQLLQLLLLLQLFVVAAQLQGSRGLPLLLLL
jgi:hypothetical protein